MNIGALSLAQTPPLRVPLPYFLSAPLFGMAAAVLLGFAGGGWSESRWSPELLALTHLMTLGFLAMVMSGAVQQILPVLAGTPLRHPRLTAHLVHFLLLGGTPALAAGLWHGAVPLLWLAGGLLGAAFLVLLVGLIGALLRTSTVNATVIAVWLAVTGLAGTVALGLHLLAGHAAPAIALGRQFTDLHMLWGLAGWVALLIMGVAFQVVPMFQLTPEYPRHIKRWLAPLVLLGIAMATLGWGNAALLLIGAALGLFASWTLWLQHRRRRRLPDVTLDYWRMAMGALLASVVLVLFGREFAGIVLFVNGFAVAAVNGMLYKIVPFLVWLHLNNRVQASAGWQGAVPHMKQIIPEARARAQFRLQLVASLLLLLGTAFPVLIRPAAAVFAFAMAGLWFNIFGAWRLYHRWNEAARLDNLEVTS